MTSISISTREAGTISCHPVVEEGDCSVWIVGSRCEQVLRFTLEPETCEELGEALVKIAQELTGRRGPG